MKTIILEGTLTAIEPLTVVVKDSINDSKTGHRLPRNGGLNADPYFPATSIRGALRHATHRHVVSCLKKSNAEYTFDLSDHFLLAQGVDIADKLKNDDQIDGAKAQRLKNPMLSLFGHWQLRGRVSIGSAFPKTKDATSLFGGGFRTIMFERTPELLDELEPSEQDRFSDIIKEQASAGVDIAEINDQIKATKKLLKTASNEEKPSIFETLNRLEDAKKHRKAEKKEAKESIRRPVDSYEAFNAGTEFTHRISIENTSDVEFGLFLSGLADFARHPRLGGHSAHNCGLVSGSYVVKSWPEDELKPSILGRISFHQDGFDVEGDELKNAISVWRSSFHEFDFRV